MGLAAAYARLLVAHPVAAKSLTACALYSGADVAAQRISGCPVAKVDLRRVAASGGVGLFFYGFSAHYWFSWVLRLVPGSGLLSLLAKTALGQLFFGPYMTLVFFAAALWSGRSFSWRALRAKAAADLLPCIIAGLGFWPLADLIAFSLLSEHYIPPFLNVCAFVWTVFLSLQAARARGFGEPVETSSPSAA